MADTNDSSVRPWRNKRILAKVSLAFILNLMYHHYLEKVLFFSSSTEVEQQQQQQHDDHRRHHHHHAINSINTTNNTHNTHNKNFSQTHSHGSRISSSSSSSSSSSFVPSWEYKPLIEPYMGNLTCMFEVAHHNLESLDNYTSHPKYEDRTNCGKWRYRPTSDWVPPSPLVVFDKLSHGSTIYIMGDSVSRQHFVDLACLMASVSHIVSVDRNWGDQIAAVDRRGVVAGYGLTGATFRSYYNVSSSKNNETTTTPTNTKKDICVKFVDGNIGALNPKLSRPRFIQSLSKVRKGDVVVLNAGLHYKSQEHIVPDLDYMKPHLSSARERGARLLWRETNAAHFDVPDGYFGPTIKEMQQTKSAKCVSHSRINATLSRQHFNGKVTPFVKSLGTMYVLETWEATYLMPEWCHVGDGKDCAHFLMPGGTSFLTELVLKYIEEEM